MFTPPCAGAPSDWKGQSTASIQPIISQERPQRGRKKSKAWGAALLRTLPQPFQDLAAWWSLDPSKKRNTPSPESSSLHPSLSPTSGSYMSRNQDNRGPGGPSTSSGHALPQLQRCPSTSSFHRPDTEQNASRHLLVDSAPGSLSLENARSFFADLQSEAQRPAANEGEALFSH